MSKRSTTLRRPVDDMSSVFFVVLCAGLLVATVCFGLARHEQRKRAIMRTNEISLIERAYQIARSGTVKSPWEVHLALKAEGYGDGQIELHMCGRSLRKDLSRLCKENRPAEQAVATD
jgi:hypothetical protein